MRHPQGHVIEAEFAEGGVEVHFQACGFVCEGGENVCVVGSRAEELTIVATCFLLCCIQCQIECRIIEYRGLRIGHCKDGCHTASEGGLGDSIPIFFVGLSRFTHVDVRVD